MNIIKKFICSIIFCGLSFTTVCGSGNSKDLMHQLETAYERLAIAEQALKKRDFDAFTVYKKYPYMPESLYAEIHLRSAYPKEYSEYIQAKGDLDDIEFMIYIIKINMSSRLGG